MKVEKEKQKVLDKQYKIKVSTTIKTLIYDSKTKELQIPRSSVYKLYHIMRKNYAIVCIFFLGMLISFNVRAQMNDGDLYRVAVNTEPGYTFRFFVMERDIVDMYCTEAGYRPLDYLKTFDKKTSIYRKQMEQEFSALNWEAKTNIQAVVYGKFDEYVSILESAFLRLSEKFPKTCNSRKRFCQILYSQDLDNLVEDKIRMYLHYKQKYRIKNILELYNKFLY